ncbi:MAG: C_GCAxxG_C_C family protein [Chloroflexi bacterium]|nr:C_GCAxxG_C_C family protein [Chloroflexota bacterium]
MQEVYGIQGDRAWQAAAGFGGGIGGKQSVCGALTGGIMALGLEAAERLADPRQVGADIRPRVRALWEGFAQEFGDVECGQLIPFDFGTPDGYAAFRQSGLREARCNRYVDYVVRTLTSWKTGS